MKCGRRLRASSGGNLNNFLYILLASPIGRVKYRCETSSVKVSKFYKDDQKPAVILLLLGPATEQFAGKQTDEDKEGVL
jgi:hypothetical protein